MRLPYSREPVISYLRSWSIQTYLYIEEEYAQWLSMTAADQAEERAEFWRQVNLRVMYDCHLIYTPTPYPMYFWWPWLKNYYGISHMQQNTEVGSASMYKYVWIDQDLKYEMTGSRE